MKDTKVKFTTNLSVKCLEDIDEIGRRIKARNKNDVIEHLVEKGMRYYDELDKKAGAVKCGNHCR